MRPDDAERRSSFHFAPAISMLTPIDDYVRRAKLIRIIDGDTIVAEIDLGFTAKTTEHIRLTRLDTPEPRGHEATAGNYVTDRLRNLLPDGSGLTIHSHKFRMDSFSRCLAEVYFGEICVNDWLIDEGLAWQTDESGKLIESRLVDNLAGIPDGIKQQVREAMV